MKSPAIHNKTLYYCKDTGSCSTDYVSILPRRLTLRPDYIARRFWDGRETVFEEVDIVPPMEAATDEMLALFAPSDRDGIDDEGELLQAVAERLRQVVMENWTPGGAHAVLHSSGIDSRILSWTIRGLYKEHGPDWLGTVLFLCSDREARSFLEIMEYEGWSKDQYRVVREGVPEPRYYTDDLTDFAGAWRRANGVHGLPVNLFWYPIEWAQEQDLLPWGGVQQWNSMWANEVVVAATNRGRPGVQQRNSQGGNTVLDAGSGGGGPEIAKAYAWFYNSGLCSRPFKGDDVVWPYTDIELATIVCRSPVRLGKELRFRLVEYLDKRLATFQNIDAEGDRFRPIAFLLREQCQVDYDRSWYARRVNRPVRIPGQIEFLPGWSRWNAASLCEHLLAEGYEIN